MTVLQLKSKEPQGNLYREVRPGLVAILLAALLAWYRRPARPPDLPHYLRADVGLSPEPLPLDWRGVPRHPVDPTIVNAWKR
jgi:hypothetical protein